MVQIVALNRVTFIYAFFVLCISTRKPSYRWQYGCGQTLNAAIS